MKLSRRRFLGDAVGLGSAALVGCAKSDQQAHRATAANEGTTNEDRDCAATPSDVEGPYFTPDSPERRSLLEDGVSGDRLIVRGRVRGADCQPIAGAVLDFWQADADGDYDNDGFTLRGHQRTDTDGRYELETIVPGRYLDGPTYRPAHIHVKIHVGGAEALTSQLYFDGDPHGEGDFGYSPDRALKPAENADGVREAAFDFSV